jgi:peroxiredoxin
VADNTITENRSSLGDPVPWFGAPLVSGGSFILHVHAGRWIVLCFLGSPANPRVKEELAALLNEASLFDEDRLIVRGIFTAPPDDVARYPKVSSKALSFLADYDGAISRCDFLVRLYEQQGGEDSGFLVDVGQDHDRGRLPTETSQRSRRGSA